MGTKLNFCLPSSRKLKTKYHLYKECFKGETLEIVAQTQIDVRHAFFVRPKTMDDHQPNPEDLRRKRRAEKLRRSYEALGKEQNQIFESLAEYTHEVQAEVRALQIARDRLRAEQAHSGASGATALQSNGLPVVLGERWVSAEAAAMGIVICGVLGVILGMQGFGWRQEKSPGGAALQRKGRRRRRNSHED